MKVEYGTKRFMKELKDLDIGDIFVFSFDPSTFWLYLGGDEEDTYFNLEEEESYCYDDIIDQFYRDFVKENEEEPDWFECEVRVYKYHIVIEE